MGSPPNIIVFLTDDHGQWAAGCYGNRDIQSTALDHLAANGARMTRAFTPCPVCSPARACFFTGKIPSAHGVHDYIEENASGEAHRGIAGQTTLAQLLHDAGYQTALCGKWHLNHFRAPPPGWDTWFTLATGTNARFGPQPYIEGDQPVEHHGHQAIFTTDRAVRFLRERDADRPFFLFVGLTDTHTPHTGAPARWVDAYRNATFADRPLEQIETAHGFARLAMTTDANERRIQLAEYYAAVSMIDEQVGRVLVELDNLQLRDDTLVVYTSDHGHMNGQHGLHTKGNATIPQNLLDESILVPSIFFWPGRISSGQVREEMVDHCDLFATLLDAAGLDAPSIAREIGAPGQSFLPLLTGQPAQPWRDAQFCEYGNARMIRTNTQKLIRRFPGPNGQFDDEFYDLSTDPHERVNRINDASFSSIIGELTGRLNEYFLRYEEPSLAGRDIASQPVCNPWQPWTTTPEKVLASRRKG